MNEQGLYDIYGHIHVPWWQSRAFIITVIIIGAVILFAALLLLIKKYYNNSHLSYEQRAKKALKVLKQKKIQTRQDAQDAYFNLTDILKKFFQEHYGISFSSMTDQEMVDVLKKTTIPPHLISALEELIESSASVKYAAQDTLQEKIMHHIHVSEQCIAELMNTKEKKK